MLCSVSPFCLRLGFYKYDPLQSAFNGLSMNCRVRCKVGNETPNLSAERRPTNFQPNIWNYDNLHYSENNLSASHFLVETYEDKNAKLLEVQVRNIINNEERDVASLLELIDSIQRLGMGYRFQNEIRKALDRFVALGGLDHKAAQSLHVTSLGFRLLRQHGFKVSQDVFGKFKNQNGKFMESPREDIEGILSLYEASHLALEGEDLLDEAKRFAISLLDDLKENSGNDRAHKIGRALELPIHYRISREEAWWNIKEFRKKEDINQVVLQLAALDFNVVQTAFQRELGDVSRWWQRLGLARKLSFSRDRLMESFFWSIGMSSLPQHSSCRKGLAKVAQLVTTIDDVYDAYGTLEELALFTEAVERWDLKTMKDLPDYMKFCFLALYNTINDIAYEALNETGENSIPYLATAWTDLCKTFFQEAKWVHNNVTPSFEDYLENAWKSSSGFLLLLHAYFLLGPSVSKQELEYLENYNELLRLPSVILRLCNDMATLSAELARGETVNSISCYMNQAGVSEWQARSHIYKVIDETWKKLNKYQVNKASFSEPFIETAINLARSSHIIYRHGDAHGAPDTKARNRVQSLIVEPISL